MNKRNLANRANHFKISEPFFNIGCYLASGFHNQQKKMGSMRKALRVAPKLNPFLWNI
jgi:hypothetical protein